MPVAVRSYVSGRHYFVLDGVKCGFLKSVEGGAAYADVIAEPPAAGPFTQKRLGSPKYEEFSIQFGFSLATALYDWIAAAWSGSWQRKSGAIIACDHNLNAISQREFLNALITETTIPACDAASKEPGHMTVKFAPEFTRFSKTSGKVAAEFRKQQHVWLPSNFRLQIDDLDCSKVSKIDSFTVKQTVVPDVTGDTRDHLQEPGQLEFPNLAITLSEVTADPWFAWHEDFVIKGNNDSPREKSGTLTLLTPNLQTELLRIEFANLGIFKLGLPKAEANADQISRVRAELYCEEMGFKFGGVA